MWQMTLNNFSVFELDSSSVICQFQLSSFLDTEKIK